MVNGKFKHGKFLKWL